MIVSMAELDFLYQLILLIAFQLGLILGLIRLAPSLGLIDRPGGRKTHLFTTPVIGGFAIYLTLLMTIALQQDWGSEVAKITIWAGLIFVISILDDIKNIPWYQRICVQMLAVSGAMVSTNIHVNSLGTYPIVGHLELGSVGYVFTGFAIICITNALNFIDGIDGLCASIILVPVSFLLALIYFSAGGINFYLLIFLISILIFLVFNLSSNQKIKIFLGDAGSTTLGFILSLIIISTAQNDSLSLNPPIALWLFFMPITDTCFVIIMRIQDRKSIFQPTKTHIHHLLILKGYSDRSTLAIMLMISVLSALVGLFLNTKPDIISLFAFLGILLLVFLYFRNAQNRTALTS